MKKEDKIIWIWDKLLELEFKEHPGNFDTNENIVITKKEKIMNTQKETAAIEKFIAKIERKFKKEGNYQNDYVSDGDHVIMYNPNLYTCIEININDREGTLNVVCITFGEKIVKNRHLQPFAKREQILNEKLNIKNDTVMGDGSLIAMIDNYHIFINKNKK